MATSTNAAGVAHARSLIAQGKINDGSWSFSAEDGNKLLGANGDDWAAFSQYFLGIHADQPPKTKAHYGYPFGKDGEVYKSALRAIASRASQQGDDALSTLASDLLKEIDAKEQAGKSAARGIQRAYSVLEIKSVNEEQRTITGIASTPDVDRMGDVVDPKGAKMKLPLPLLWQHDSFSPIGTVNSAKTTSKGIEIVAQIAQGVSDEIDKAWALIKSGLVRGLSIGFRGIDTEQIPNSWGLLFKTWELLEVSAVTIPANAAATIQTVKSFDQAASGRPVVRVTAGVSAPTPKPTEAPPMKTAQEQVSAFEATRQAKAARMSEIMNAAAETGSTLDDAQRTEYDSLESDVRSVDEHLVRLRKHAATVAATAVAVDTNTNNSRDVVVRPNSHITVERRLPKGTAFTRSVMALIRAKGNRMEAEVIARNDPAWKDTPEVAEFWKTAVAAGTTTDSAFAGPLAPFIPMQNEFIDLLRPTLLIGRIAGFRNIPFMVSMPRQTGGATAGWVGEGLGKGVQKQAFETIKMPPTKIAVITVITDELARYSTPSAEAVITNDLLKSIQQYQDQQFVDPTVTASAGVRPASITNGAFNALISGTTIALITADINKLIGNFITANLYPEAGAFIMHPRTAQYLGTLRTTQDILAFPGISMMGGVFFGFPVYTSTSVPIDTGDDAIIILMDAAEVFIAEDGGIELDVSREASLQMNTAPDNPPSASSVFTSLWQENLVGLRSEHRVGWLRRRDAGVAYLKGVSY